MIDDRDDIPLDDLLPEGVADQEEAPEINVPTDIFLPEAIEAALVVLARRHGWKGDGKERFNELAGCNPRSMRRWLSGEWDMSAEVMTILLALLRDETLADALANEYEDGPLRPAVSETMDRMFFVLHRDPSILAILRGQSLDSTLNLEVEAIEAHQIMLDALR